MYSNIGGKIKGAAKLVVFLVSFVSIIEGIAALERGIGAAIIFLVVIPVIAWISSWLIYAFGELVEKTCEIAENTRYIAVLCETKFVEESEEKEE